MTLIIQKPTGAKLNLKQGYNSAFADADVQAYLTAVETADGQALEYRTAVAIDEFVRGCKADGIWSAIKASCILAGARTLAGALVPLVGTAPTNFNFVAGDYNRETGLVGNGSTKYLNSNRNNNADPQNSKHAAVHMTTHQTRDVIRGVLGVPNFTGSTQLLTNNTQRVFRANMTAIDTTIGLVTESNDNAGFWGVSRTSSTALGGRYGGATTVFTSTNSATNAETIQIFRRGTDYSNARLAFYSIGESLDLALLDARVTDLINAFAAAIP
jgi:hypothetical protein